MAPSGAMAATRSGMVRARVQRRVAATGRDSKGSLLRLPAAERMSWPLPRAEGRAAAGSRTLEDAAPFRRCACQTHAAVRAPNRCGAHTPLVRVTSSDPGGRGNRPSHVQPSRWAEQSSNSRPAVQVGGANGSCPASAVRAAFYVRLRGSSTSLDAPAPTPRPSVPLPGRCRARFFRGNGGVLCGM
jgi:hypothetical protein